MLPSFLSDRGGLLSMSPGPLIGSTLVIAVLWIMHQGRGRQLSWTSRPLPPHGYHLSPATSSRMPVRVALVAGLSEGTSEFHEWVLATTTRFHGKPWLLHTPNGSDVLVLSSPQAFENVQRTFVSQFEKAEQQVEGLGFDVHGDVNAASSGSLRPSIQAQRILASSVLTSPVFRRMASELVAKHTEKLVEILKEEEGETCWDVDKLMRQFSLEVFAELGFGLQLGSVGNESSAFEKAVDDVKTCAAKRSKRAAAVWKMERMFHFGDEAVLRCSLETVRKTTSAVVETKMKMKQSGSDGRARAVDMIDLLLQRKSNSKSSKDPEFLAKFVLGIVVAARDAMANSLSKCLQCLARYPEEQEKLFLEEPTREGQSLVYLDAVVKETLRLFPAKPFIRRRAKFDVVLSDGTFVAAGTEIAMDLFGMARQEPVWGPGSAEFRPQRWIDPRTGKLRPASSYKFNAFLGGPRVCLGEDLAVTGMKTVIAGMINEVQIDLCKGSDSGKDSSIDSGEAIFRFHRRGLCPPGHCS